MAFACFGLVGLVLATSPTGTSGAASSGVVEVNVMNAPVRGGEPQLAVNPRKPQQVVLGHTVVGNSYANNSTEAGLEAVGGGLQVSRDGGRTWSADRALPTKGYREGPNQYQIAKGFTSATGFTLDTDGVGDPIEAAGPDGSIYAGGVIANAVPPGPPPFNFTVPQGGILVFRSTNGGKSFGPFSAAITDQLLQGMVDRGMHPKGIPAFGVNPFDRPWISVDQSNGDVYVSTTAHPQRYVVVSHDKTKTWSSIEALDCDEATPSTSAHDVTCDRYPAAGEGTISAAHGVLAAAYTASAAPGATCPCLVFGTTTDAGAHWKRHVATQGLPAGTSVFVAADPAQQGRFALLTLSPSATAKTAQEVQVVTTVNSGRTWSKPISLGDESVDHVTNRPWISYGPTGVLAASWRNAYPPYDPSSFLVPGAQNVFAAVSRDNGKTFSAPIQLNSEPSPPPDPEQLAEDDVGWVTVTSKYVYGAWGDWRPTSGNPVATGSDPPSGEMNAWIARVPIKSFTTR